MEICNIKIIIWTVKIGKSLATCKIHQIFQVPSFPPYSNSLIFWPILLLLLIAIVYKNYYGNSFVIANPLHIKLFMILLIMV